MISHEHVTIQKACHKLAQKAQKQTGQEKQCTAINCLAQAFAVKNSTLAVLKFKKPDAS